MRERSIEDKYMMSYLQASSVSEHLQNDYAIVLTIDYAQGHKSSSVMRIPITILPIVSPEVQAISVPENFESTELVAFEADLNDYEEAASDDNAGDISINNNSSTAMTFE